MLDTLCVEIDDATIEQLVNGLTTFYDVFGSEQTRADMYETENDNNDTVDAEEIPMYEWDLRDLVEGDANDSQ